MKRKCIQIIFIAADVCPLSLSAGATISQTKIGAKNYGIED